MFALRPRALPVIPSWHGPVPRAAAFAVGMPAPAPARSSSVQPRASTSSVHDATAARSPDPRSLALLAWLAVAAWLLARAIASHALAASLTRRARVRLGTRWARALAGATDAVGLASPLTLSTSDELSLPIVVGLSRPGVLLPRAADGWDEATLHRVLLHELAHVRRSDLAWLTLGRLLTAVFWFHPLVWFACARLKAEAEQACDDVVLSAGERATDYASLLLELAASGPRPSRAAGLAVLTREHLTERIDSILAPARGRAAATRGGLGLVFGSAGLLAVLVAMPSFEPARASDPPGPVRHPARVHVEASTPLRIFSATVRARAIGSGRTQLDAPEIEVENTGARAIRSVQVKLHTPGVSDDRVWNDQLITPGEHTVVRVPAEHWWQEVPSANASRFEAGIASVRFVDEPRSAQRDVGADVAPAPPSATPTPTPGARHAPKAAPGPTKWTPAPAPPASSGDVLLYHGDGPRVQASVWNPENAPVVIEDAWVPRDPPAPSGSEAERAFDRGHAVTWQPGLALHNTSARRVVGLRLRFKADPESHAVTGVEESIEPGQWLFLLPRGSMWGKPDAMTVQVLGVRFADAGTWGSLDSTIDTRQGWIR
jgi:beta-lactamase regulating signal transducer with metallopeptidase domain